MQKDLSDITVVLDRSGSMASIQSDAEGGLNSFVDEQKKLPGRANFTLVQFDTEYEFVHKAIDLQATPKLELKPRGGTALFDALGRAMTETGERLKAMNESDRPGLVVFVIVTDGQENSSREFKLPQIRDMIKTQQDTYKWQFTFLSSDLSVFDDAKAMEIKTSGVLGFTDIKAAYAAGSLNLGRMRAASATGGVVSNAYTDDEKRAAGGNWTPKP